MKKLAIAALFSLALTAAHATVTLTPTSTGLQIAGDSDLLKFTMSYPVLNTTDKKKSYSNKGAEVKDSNTVAVKYEGGGEIDIAIDSTGTITMQGTNLPPDIGYVELRMVIGLTFDVGGTFQFDAVGPTPFPENLGKDHLFNKNAQTFILRGGDGKGLKITAPLYAYQEITDMRAWGTQSFGWMAQALYHPDAAMSFRIEDAGEAPAAADGSGTDSSATNAAPANP